MKEKVLERLNITTDEIELFNKLKDNYYLSIKLFSIDNEVYKLRVEVDTTSLGYLLNNITEKDLFYTLYQGRKTKYKNKTKAQMINLIKNIL